MKKIISMFLASLLLAGCSSAPKPDPTPTATPEPTVEPTPEVEKKLTSGYIQVERDGECYWDDEGNFIHSHPLDLDNYIIDTKWSYSINDVNGICTDLETYPEGIEHYILNNGEIKYYDGFTSGSNDAEIVNKIKNQCIGRYENALEFANGLKGE